MPNAPGQVRGHPLATQTAGSGDPRRLYTSADYRDFILVDRVSRKQPDYEAQPDGTAYPWVGGGENPFPNHKLVFQEEEQDGEHIVRYYASDWPAADQQPSNALITFSGDSKDHPIYTRLYILPRRTFVPLTRLAPLSGLTRTSITSGGEGYTQNSVATLTGGTGSGGVVKCFVNPDGEVIDLQIVTPGTYTVAPTVSISIGTGAVVAASIQPQDCVLISEDEVGLGDQHVSSLFVGVRRTYETLPGPALYGQDWDRRLGIMRPFTKQITVAGAHAGEDNTRIEPISSAKQEVITENVTAFQTELDAYHLAIPVNIKSLRLPDVLKSVTILYNTRTGAGTSETDPAGNAVGSSANLSLSDHSHSQGSAAVEPELISDRGGWDSSNQPPGTNHTFFAPEGSTRAQVIALLSALLGRSVTSIVAGVVTTAPAADGTVGHNLALNQIFKFTTVTGGSGGIAANTSYYVKTIPTSDTFTYSATSGGAALSGHAATSAVSAVPINEMPIWYPVPHTIVGLGGSVSVSADASAQQSVSLGPSNTSVSHTTGWGKSKEGSLTNRSWQIPPTIHPLITIGGTNPGAQTASAGASASTGPAATNWLSVASGSITTTSTITAVISPAVSLPATTPAAWPTAGLYITEFEPESFDADRMQVLIQLLDFATIPAP